MVAQEFCPPFAEPTPSGQPRHRGQTVRPGEVRLETTALVAGEFGLTGLSLRWGEVVLNTSQDSIERNATLGSSCRCAYGSAGSAALKRRADASAVSVLARWARHCLLGGRQERLAQDSGELAWRLPAGGR